MYCRHRILGLTALLLLPTTVACDKQADGKGDEHSADKAPEKAADKADDEAPEKVDEPENKTAEQPAAEEVKPAEEPEAAGKPARCKISSGGGTTYDGDCNFLLEVGGKGSFAITAPEGQSFDGANPISVSIVEPGIAEVRGLTADGINSRWGEAKRSDEDRACWTGEDFNICVYGT